MLNARGPLLLVLSLSFAAAAAWFANRWLLAQDQQRAAREPTVSVVVAAVERPANQPLEAGHLARVQLPPGALPKGVFHDPAALVGRKPRRSLDVGELVLAERLVPVGESVLSPNMRAVSVRVTDVLGLAGAALEGNRVDVVAAWRENGQPRSETLLQRARVLAVEARTEGGPGQGPPSRVVTLEVRPLDAERLVLAEQRGNLQLAVRHPLDDSLIEADSPLAPLGRQPATLLPPPPLPTPAAPPRVTVIRGTTLGSDAPGT